MVMGDLIVNSYPGVLTRIMEGLDCPHVDQRVPNTADPFPGGYLLPAESSPRLAVQYAEYYISGRRYPQRTPPYPYNIYLETLQDVLRILPDEDGPKRRISHLDIGSGAGTFSWALLDWATDQNIPYENISLFGLDRCKAMVELATQIRQGLIECGFGNYPELHYFAGVQELLEKLKQIEGPTDWIITFGLSLTQAYSQEEQGNVAEFAGVIEQIQQLENTGSIVLVASDSQRDNNNYNAAWIALLQQLHQDGTTRFARLRYPRLPR